ncbi:MAG: DUF362 domain-containing protein [Desulfobacterales bacterium]|nr:DUF362 domain-containing protein [Desulfobacterales bacterium]
MKSTVYFMDLRATYKVNLLTKLGRLLDAAGLDDVIKKRDLTAVKLHFGEPGNLAFIRPVFLREIVKKIKGSGGAPFLTDANTLYAGARRDAPHHLKAAIQNGFDYAVVDAPVIIADGLRGKSETAVKVGGKHFDSVYIGSEIVEADALVSVAHFKGHELSGFGGTLKNLGMGAASRKGKLAQHSGVSPKITRKKCVGCGECIEHCAENAISMLEVERKAEIRQEKCVGCGECIIVCPNEAVNPQWSKDIPVFLEKMMEYTHGVLKNKKGKSLFVNFIMDISPKCDCLPSNDAPIVRDIGVVASTDPVAIEQASVDLVNGEPALSSCCLKRNTAPGEDKFKGLFPKTDWAIQLDYAESLGLGVREYVLESIETED